MKCSIAPAYVTCALAGVLVLHAQDASSSDSTGANALGHFAPMTLGQKYGWASEKALGGPGLALVVLKASYDQTFNKPHQWGGDPESFAVRSASRFGRSFLRQNIAFGVRALDGEDPRYFVSGHGSKWTRVKYAVVHTFEVRSDSGNWMPAYSVIVAAYATPFLANQWRPDRHGAGWEFGVGTAGLGIAVGANLCQEFWPDLRKKLGRHASFLVRSSAAHP